VKIRAPSYSKCRGCSVSSFSQRFRSIFAMKLERKWEHTCLRVRRGAGSRITSLKRLCNDYSWETLGVIPRERFRVQAFSWRQKDKFLRFWWAFCTSCKMKILYRACERNVFLIDLNPERHTLDGHKLVRVFHSSSLNSSPVTLIRCAHIRLYPRLSCKYIQEL